MATATNRRRPKRRATPTPRLFRSIVEEIDRTQYLGIKAGARTDHRFIGIGDRSRTISRSWGIGVSRTPASVRIDPQMGPCMMTSRIVQAISSVQLFIHRCFMSLEPEVPPASLDKTHWEWMTNYRVWEANRKVLLYPENWIEPELRDDRTP